MFCYYCGQKVDETKQLTLISNKVLFDMEIRNMEYDIQKQKDLIKSLDKTYKLNIKKAETSEEKELLMNEATQKLNEAKNVLNDLTNKLNERKANASALEKHPNFVDQTQGEVKSAYICPRCGHIVHEGYEEKEIKSLSAACHAELQRGRNDFARGMSALSIAIILGIIAFIFLLLSKKADIQYQISTTCPEFWVFLVLGIISVILLVLGAVLVTRGVKRKSMYSKLLKDINRKTFVQ